MAMRHRLAKKSKKRIVSVSMIFCLTMMLMLFTGCSQIVEHKETKKSSKEEETVKGSIIEIEEPLEEAPEEIEKIAYDLIDLSENREVKANIKWVHSRADCEEDGTIERLIAEFNKDFPDITVIPEGISDYDQNSLIQFSKGDWGDVIFIPNVKKEDLYDFFVPLGKTDNISKTLNLVDEWAYEGITYGVPYKIKTAGVLYNKNLIDEESIIDLPENPEDLFENFPENVEKIVNGEIEAIAIDSNIYSKISITSDMAESLGYMVFPVNALGKKCALVTSDYNYGINIYSDEINQLASMIFIKWMVEKSDWNYNEGGYTVVKNGNNPDIYEEIDGYELMADWIIKRNEEKEMIGDENAE